MKVLLLSLPQSSTNQPYSSLPSLSSFLKMNGYQVQIRDINIEAYENLLTPDNLRRVLKTIEGRIEEIRKYEEISEFDQTEYEVLLKAQLSSRYIIKHISEAKDIKRDPEKYYDLERCNWAHNVLLRGLELISAAHYPSRWTLDDLLIYPDVRNSQATLLELLGAARNRKENLFQEYFQEEVLPSVIKSSPQIVGISITYATQVIASLAMAEMIKQANPQIHICLGGAWIGQDRLWIQPELFSIVDSIVVGEGEHALLSLIQKLETRNQDWTDVPHLIYFRGGKIIKNDICFLEDVNALPTPDWSDLPLKLYFSPEFVPLLPTARGCYWGRCAFCTFAQATSRKYRPRHVELILQDMQTLHNQYGTTHFSLSSDAESPMQLMHLAQGVKNCKLPFVWECETRLSPALTKEMCQTLYDGGCRYLSFGMESACQRVLDLMEKGTQAADFSGIIRNCFDSGIGVNIMTFIGFPTESEKEAEMTVDFLLENHDWIDTVALGQFVLQPGSRVDRDPRKYGVLAVDRESVANSDVVLGYNYKVSSGMSQNKVTELLKRQISKLGRKFTNPISIVFLIDAFLYTDHYGISSLVNIKRKYFNNMFNLLDRKPKISPELQLTHCHFVDLFHRQQIIFFSRTAELIQLDSQALRLLYLCDGTQSVEEIASKFANENLQTSYVISYFKALKKINLLYVKKILDI